MSTERPPDGDDPWLTVAEVAEELRLNPATIRLWISKGQLSALRVGPRRLLIRRSDLDRTLAFLRGDRIIFDDLAPDQRWQFRQFPPVSKDQLVARDTDELRADAGEIERLMDGLRRADAAWTGSRASSDDAPPDSGFPHRLQDLAEAAEMQRFWLSLLASTKGFEWEPVATASHLQISHELRAGANRPGRQHLWDLFDMAVERLAHALEHGPLASVIRAYSELSGQLLEISRELLDERQP